MTDLSKRANLLGVREVRGLLTPIDDSPTGLTGADWADLVNVRADSESDPENWIFRGEASVVDHDYMVRDMFGEFTERIATGAFDKTLSENPDVMFNYMHDPAQTMVTTRGGGLALKADPHLFVDAVVPRSDVDAQRVMPKVQRGDAQSMSFAFRVMRQEWNDDYTDRTITEVSLHRGDVAVIVSGLGANPAAWGTVRAQLDATDERGDDDATNDRTVEELRAVLVPVDFTHDLEVQAMNHRAENAGRPLPFVNF